MEAKVQIRKGKCAGRAEREGRSTVKFRRKRRLPGELRGEGLAGRWRRS